MPDLSGQSLGRYHLLEQLGQGGMATVYKAYDTRLERDVAVKIIRRGAFPPEQLERILKRFEREAKALARLSHTNIVKVIDYGEHEGNPYLVMEYLPGGTLKTRLGKPIPWQEAFKLILPIAEALEYAHQQHIVHRDVKPSNILINSSGQPMLTDFGVAKILDLEEGQTLTGTGVGVGTPEYMSPEQSLGRLVDHRADIYSLGVVLYEMITGRKPYTADTPMAVIDMHLHDPLPRPSKFMRDLPEPVEKILLKAMAKASADRYVDMSVFAGEMERLLVGERQMLPDMVELGEKFSYERGNIGKLKAGDREPTRPPIRDNSFDHPKLPSKKRKISVWAFGVVGLLLILLCLSVGLIYREDLGAAFFSSVTPTTTLSPSFSFSATYSSTMTPSSTPSFTPTIIGGGGRIAFLSDRDGNVEIYAMSSDGSDVTRLTNNPADDWSPTWSPDGSKIAFVSTRDGGNWEIYVLELDGGSVIRLTNNSVYDSAPAWSPDGNKIAFISLRDGNWEIYSMAVDGSGVTRLTNNFIEDGDPAWSPDGSQIVFSSGALGFHDIYLMNADGSVQKRLTTDPGDDVQPAWSPDGKQIAFMSDRSGNVEIYIMEIDGSKVTRLTRDPAINSFPAWSPDGKLIAFSSYGDWAIYVMNIDGSGMTRLTNYVGADFFTDWVH